LNKKDGKFMNALSEILRDNRFTPEDLPDFENKLFFKGPHLWPFLVRFFVLLFLSTVIAAFGVINDSTATVIGAMIIAPLMTPIMATAAAIVIGKMDWSLRSLLLVALGVTLVIVVSWLIGAFFNTFSFVSITQNSQITSRISPRLTDLFIALASGAAGAFAFSRDDIADSLPGVAISISLVPPLCVVGITLSEGEWTAAWGAMLLFLTNFFSILLAGGGVLALLGLGAASTQNLKGHRRRRAFIIIALGLLLITIALAGTSVRVTKETLTEFQVSQNVREWLAQSAYEPESIDAHGGAVTLTIIGEGELPPLPDLQSEIVRRTRRPDVVDLVIVPVERHRLVMPQTE
jgi:uncharacterized hydrophobic protein (TIGR00271 family)